MVVGMTGKDESLLNLLTMLSNQEFETKCCEWDGKVASARMQ